MLLFTVAKTLGFPVSLFDSYLIQMAWVYHTRGPGPVGSVWASYTLHPIDFCLRADWFPDCLSFTTMGFLGSPCWSRLLSSYQQPGTDRVKAVILENWMRRGKMCTMCVCMCMCAREIQCFLSTSRHS